jgi:hypothetical protein
MEKCAFKESFKSLFLFVQSFCHGYSIFLAVWGVGRLFRRGRVKQNTCFLKLHFLFLLISDPQLSVYFYKNDTKLGMVAYTCNSSTQNAEARGSQAWATQRVQGQLRLHNPVSSHKKGALICWLEAWVGLVNCDYHHRVIWMGHFFGRNFD